MRLIIASLIASHLLIGSAFACDHKCPKSEDKKCGEKQASVGTEKNNNGEMKASLRVSKESDAKQAKLGRHGQSALAREKILR